MSWQVIQYVSSGFTLCAFIVAVVAAVINRLADSRLKSIQSASEADRAGLVQAELEFFNVNTQNLTKEQQFTLAVHQIQARAKRFFTIAVVVILLALIGASLTAYAISRPVPSPTSGQAPPGSNTAPPDNDHKRPDDGPGTGSVAHVGWCENLDGEWEMVDRQNVNSGLFTMTISHDDAKHELTATRSDGGSISKYLRSSNAVNHWIGTTEYYPSTGKPTAAEMTAESNCTRLVFANPRFYFVHKSQPTSSPSAEPTKALEPAKVDAVSKRHVAESQRPLVVTAEPANLCCKIIPKQLSSDPNHNYRLDHQNLDGPDDSKYVNCESEWREIMVLTVVGQDSEKAHGTIKFSMSKPEFECNVEQRMDGQKLYKTPKPAGAMVISDKLPDRIEPVTITPGDSPYSFKVNFDAVDNSCKDLPLERKVKEGWSLAGNGCNLGLATAYGDVFKVWPHVPLMEGPYNSAGR
jgi:hypothetical protein